LWEKNYGCARRAADMATFQFGSRIKVQDFHGRSAEVGEHALHVQCDWRIIREGQIFVASRDLHYPAEYDGTEAIPSEFDWEQDPNRRDHLLAALFSGNDSGFKVRSINVGLAGSFGVDFEGGVVLEVFPDDSLANEHWRLLNPTTDNPHFVFSSAPTES
jgi:hypothetical protein